jgi:DNA mismatch repair protein MutL
VPQFVTEIRSRPTAGPSLAGAQAVSTPANEAWRAFYGQTAPDAFALQAPRQPLISEHLHFTQAIEVEANDAPGVERLPQPSFVNEVPSFGEDTCAPPLAKEPVSAEDGMENLSSLKPLGQLRESFILAVNHEGLWIIDQHVAHERVLFEKVLKQRARQQVESQRLLMPIVIELTPAQQVVFADISDELQKNGFDAEPFGARSIAVKVAPAGVQSTQVEHMLHELLDHFSHQQQTLNLEQIRGRIAASIACHAAIKVNMPLEQNKMEWLLAELAKTDCPMSCPHGRPVVLRYSLKDIQKAFKRI